MKEGNSASTSGFSKTTLACGVRVLTETIPSIPSISVGLWIDAGSRDEALEESGISHFIEHMVFKGTRRRRTHHIAQRLESVGGYLNAFTSKEHTCFYARALGEHLERAVDLLSDLILDPVFPEKEVEKEKDVVLEEMKMYEDAPEEYVFDLFDAAVYGAHELGRPVIGLPDTVRGFSQDMLFSYLSRRYTADRIVLAVAGNVRHEKVVSIAERIFNRVDRPAHTPSRGPVNGYAPAHRQIERPIQQAHLVLGAQGINVKDDRRGALTVLNTVLGGGMSGRLNQNVREKYGFCYNIYSFTNLYSDSGDVGIYMGTDKNRVETSKRIIFRELARLAQKPVSVRALTQAKVQVKGSMLLALESMSSRMMRLARQELYLGRYVGLEEVAAEIERVTVDDVQQLAGELFDPARFSTVVLLPQNGSE
jgi:predicted Zn-dependent peptidase